MPQEGRGKGVEQLEQQVKINMPYSSCIVCVCYSTPNIATLQLAQLLIACSDSWPVSFACDALHNLLFKFPICQANCSFLINSELLC